MASRAAHQTAESDAEIFFASIFGASLVLLLNEMLCSLVFQAGTGTLGPSLLSRTVPVTSVRLLYTFFVLLPAFVAFTAIGLPFFLRTLRSLFNGHLPGNAKRGLVLLVAGIALAAVELHTGRNGQIAISAIAATGYVAGFRAIATIGRAHGSRLLAAAGIALAALAWYENRVLQGVAPEIAVAPTALVAAGFFAATGLLTATAGAMERGREEALRLGICWVAALAWLGAPLLRPRITANALLADRMELVLVTGAAAILVLASLLRRVSREFRSD